MEFMIIVVTVIDYHGNGEGKEKKLSPVFLLLRDNGTFVT